MLICADETALPAASAALEWLPAGVTARVWLEVPHTEDRLELRTEADAAHHLARTGRGRALRRGGRARRRTARGRPPYVWIAGESSGVRALRRHFVRERGFDRRRVTFVGYWRRGLSEEQLREEVARVAA